MAEALFSGTRRAPPQPALTYQAYGLVIRSTWPLPELLSAPVGGKPDIVIRETPLARRLPAPGEAVYEFSGQHAYIGIGGAGHFEITGPGEVLFDCAPGGNPAYVTFILLGSVMATVLLMRGYLTLHASGVTAGERAVLFLGAKGAGKSTAAAALVAAGWPLLADDIVPIALDDGTARALPGYPLLKLSAASGAVIRLPGAQASPLANTGFEKNRLCLAGSFATTPARPALIYMLAPGDVLDSAPLAGAEALAELMGNAYHARFGANVFHGAAAARLLRQCAALARLAPVRLLRVPRRLDCVHDIAGFAARELS